MVDTAGGDVKRWARSRLGTVIKGKYRLDDVIGIGGMAVVFKATHRNQAELAVKMLLPELSFREDLKARFLREGLAANSVKHAGVVRVVDDDVAEDGAAFLVMDLLQGESVEALWARKNHRLPVAAAVGIVDQLLDVLSAAHAKGIIHRDIKPANLFLTTDGTLKVLDFGIARVKDAMASGAQSSTHTGLLLGTPAFMAPEQAKALTSEIDGRTDLWAAGATLFTLVCGEFVHKGETAALLLINSATTTARPISIVSQSVPQPVAAVVDKALAFEKGQRWQDANAMRDALREAHRSVYGTMPSRELLLSSIASASSETGAAVAPQHTVRLTPPSSPHVAIPQVAASSPRFVGGTTAQPVSARDSSVPTRSLVPLLAVAGALALLVAVGVTWKLTHRDSSTTAVSPVSPVVSSAPIAVTSAPVSSTVPSATATATAVDVLALPAASATAHIAASTTRTTAPSSQASSAPATITTVKPTPNCSPPFTIDSAGHKIFKKECL